MPKMLRAVLVIATLVASLPADAAWTPIDESWLGLWNRCRLAVENGTEVDHSGLIAAEPRTDVLGTVAKVWSDPSSIFEVIENEPDGGTHQCRVSIKDGQWPSDATDIVAIIGSFEQQRQELIAAGSHTLRNMDRVAPYAGALGPIHRSPSGCSVISTLIITPAERSFISLSGEQVAQPCEPATIAP
jgi:hypothetical protein